MQNGPYSLLNYYIFYNIASCKTNYMYFQTQCIGSGMSKDETVQFLLLLLWLLLAIIIIIIIMLLLWKSSLGYSLIFTFFTQISNFSCLISIIIIIIIPGLVWNGRMKEGTNLLINLKHFHEGKIASHYKSHLRWPTSGTFSLLAKDRARAFF